MKILVADFDYTFFTLDYIKNIRSVQQFVAEGNMFIIATGRNLKQLLDDVKDLYVPYFFLICNDGALIYDRKNELFYEKEIPIDIANSLYHKLDKCRFLSEIYMDNGSECSIHTEDKVIKIIAKPKNFDKAMHFLPKLLENFPEVDGYISESWLNIVSKEATKGKGIEFLLQKFHLDANEVYVVGDGPNDISMLEKYKGYALTSSPLEVQEKALGTIATFQDIFAIMKQG